MKRQTLRVVFLIISLLLFLGIIVLLVAMSSVDKLTQSNTTAYTATVRTVQITDTGKHISARITTGEYVSDLYVSPNVSTYILDDLKKLREGDNITFRVENYKTTQMNAVAFIDIVSLAVDGTEVLSLACYNEWTRQAVEPARITGIVLAAICFAAALYFAVALKKKN